MGKLEGRNRSPAWAAYYALQGDEDPAALREYVEEAYKLVSKEAGPLDFARSDHEGWAGLKVFLLTLKDALDPQGSTYMELRLEHRKTTEQGGRRRLSLDEIRRRRHAGARAYGYIKKANMKKSEAIERAWEDLRELGEADGLSARIIEREYDRYRRSMTALNGLST